jgi:hypothetical protein
MHTTGGDVTMPARRRRWRAGTTVAALLLGLSAQSAAASQPTDPPGVVSREVVTVGTVFEDPAAGLVALLGPPPELGCLGLGFDDPAWSQWVDTPSGAVVSLIRATEVPVRVYAATSIEDVCGPVWEGGDPPAALATGSARVRGTDNDVFLSGTRTSTWGGSATGTLTRWDGASCRFAAQGRWQLDRDGTFRPLLERVGLACGRG